jgi:ribosomal protein S1
MRTIAKVLAKVTPPKTAKNGEDVRRNRYYQLTVVNWWKVLVVGINDRDVILNIGFKSDGLVPLAEFKDHAKPENR